MSSPSSARSLFTRFLQRLEREDDLDFEAWVREHPQLEPELRRLHAGWKDARSGGPGTFSFFTTQAERPRPRPGLEPGKVVGDFRLIELIGRGGMGQVWEARQLSLGERRVAVKFVHPERVTDRQLAYFEREARAGGRLAHPGIVAVHGFGEDGGIAWIALELVEGYWTLRDFVDEAARADEIPPGYDRRVAHFVAAMADAVHAAHEAGVIHRDLKPQNVLVAPDQSPKITDFGLARIVDESALSQTGDLAGTYYYMSPEQLSARRSEVDHRTDVFSLGVVMYEMLTLRRPFQGDTAQQVAEQITRHDPPDMRSLRSRIPPELALICGKALEKDPTRRYATMDELAADLRRYLAHEPIHARPPGRLDRLVKWTRRNPTRSAAALVAAVAFVVISALALRIAGQNRDLELKTREASASAEAERRRADEVLRLSLAQDYQDLVQEAETLWPAPPDRIPALEDWLSRAEALRAQLPELVLRRDELRALALPWSDEQRAADLAGHPARPELARVRRELAFRRGALRQRRDGIPVELPDVDWRQYPEEPDDLNVAAIARVDPRRTRFGDEAEGYVLAERSLEVAPDAQRRDRTIVLAWAAVALGRDEEALALAQLAHGDAPPAQQPVYRATLELVAEAVRSSSSPEALAAEAARVEELEREVAELETRVSSRRTWRFDESDGEGARTRWWHDQLVALIENLERLGSGGGLLDPDGFVEGGGWSVPRRLALARHLRDGFAPGGEYELRWQAARAGIANVYPGLELEPQVGLVPIGADPSTGLWEFWHIQSGSEPARDAQGQLVLDDASGIVLVLLHGGPTWLGTQADDPEQPNYDPFRVVSDQRLHEVDLEPFFLSKFEMTQGQWQHVRGSDPSRYGVVRGYDKEWNRWHRRATLREPVESIDWTTARSTLAQLGLSLPTEAQWEHGARAGTDTPWFTGAEPQSLQGAANLADLHARRKGGEHWPGFEEWLDDGYTNHAPVDTLRPNGFGLHHVLGNVWEWCDDVASGSEYRPDVFRDVELNPSRAARGGSYGVLAATARSGTRMNFTPTNTNSDLGVRPARTISR